MGYLKGSICLEDLFAASKAGHEAFNKGKNGKTYANIILWTNEEADQFGNTGSIQLMQPKESTAKKVYVGNIKGNKLDNQSAAPQQAQTVKPEIQLNDELPF